MAWLYNIKFKSRDIKRFCLFAYWIFYFLSGWAYNPLAAFIIAALYEAAFLGLIIMYLSAFEKANPKNWFMLIIGFCLILFSSSVLNVLYWR